MIETATSQQNGQEKPKAWPPIIMTASACPVEGNGHTRFETKTGLHVGTGYTRIVICGRGSYIEFLPGQLILENLHIPDEEKHRKDHPWKDRVYYAEWRTKDGTRVKVYEQYQPVDYADYRMGLLYISPQSSTFFLFAHIQSSGQLSA